MQYHEFVGQVQDRARLGSEGEAMQAIRATLSALGTRLHGGEANDIAAQLPDGIAHFLTRAERNEPLTMRAFYEQVQEAEQVDFPEAVFHARVVMQVLEEAISGGEMQDIRAQLPAEYEDLFEPVGE